MEVVYIRVFLRLRGGVFDRAREYIPGFIFSKNSNSFQSVSVYRNRFMLLFGVLANSSG